jgi:hypothetical protein
MNSYNNIGDIDMNEQAQANGGSSRNILDRIKKKPKAELEAEKQVYNEENYHEHEARRFNDIQHGKPRKFSKKKTEQELDPDWLPYESRGGSKEGKFRKFKKNEDNVDSHFASYEDKRKPKMKKLGGKKDSQIHDNDNKEPTTSVVNKTTEEPAKIKIDLKKSNIIPK